MAPTVPERPPLSSCCAVCWHRQAVKVKCLASTRSNPPKHCIKKTGVVTEHAQMYDHLSGMENLMFYGTLFGVNRSDCANVTLTGGVFLQTLKSWQSFIRTMLRSKTTPESAILKRRIRMPSAEPVPFALFVPYGAKFRALKKDVTTMKETNKLILTKLWGSLHLYGG